MTKYLVITMTDDSDGFTETDVNDFDSCAEALDLIYGLDTRTSYFGPYKTTDLSESEKSRLIEMMKDRETRLSLEAKSRNARREINDKQKQIDEAARIFNLNYSDYSEEARVRNMRKIDQLKTDYVVLMEAYDMIAAELGSINRKYSGEPV